MTMLNKRNVFLANAKSAELTQLQTWGNQLLALGAGKVTSASAYWRKMSAQTGGFKAWPQTVVLGRPYGSAQHTFDVLVFPSRLVGKATAEIAQLALQHRRPCYLLERGDLVEINECQTNDPRDWFTGWELITPGGAAQLTSEGPDGDIPF